jgi:hypothetical protein
MWKVSIQAMEDSSSNRESKNPCGSREKYSVFTAAFPSFEMIISRKMLKQDGHRNSEQATKNSPAMLCTTWTLVGTKGKLYDILPTL